MGSPEWRYKLRKNALGSACFMPFRYQSDRRKWLAKKFLYLLVMGTRKNIRIPFCYISFFIVLGCSKSDHQTKPPAAILNTFTYTVTDTLGASFTFSDTVIYNPDSNKYFFTNSPLAFPTGPVAYILPPDTGNYNMHKFNFDDEKSMFRNYVTFYLPYFQSTLSGTTDLPNSSLVVQLDRIFYNLAPRPPFPLEINAYLASCSTSTNISDSSGGFVSGTFNISAATADSGKIKISGQFLNAPANYNP
jgi:hypothetical protein